MVLAGLLLVDFGVLVCSSGVPALLLVVDVDFALPVVFSCATALFAIVDQIFSGFMVGVFVAEAVGVFVDDDEVGEFIADVFGVLVGDMVGELIVDVVGVFGFDVGTFVDGMVVVAVDVGALVDDVDVFAGEVVVFSLALVTDDSIACVLGLGRSELSGTSVRVSNATARVVVEAVVGGDVARMRLLFDVFSRTSFFTVLIDFVAGNCCCLVAERALTMAGISMTVGGIGCGR